MLGEFKPVEFDRYGRRRRRGLPRWLVLLLLGLAIGVAGVIYVQEQLLPPRLSYEASTRLRQDYDQADAERQRLAAELAAIRRQRDALQAERDRIASQLADDRKTIEQLRADVATLVAALPPDPRGGEVAVRAGRFRAASGTLAYEVLLTRDAAAGRPMAGQLQLVVAGRNERGVETTVALPPVAVSIGTHHSVSGEAALPAGFAPQQVTVRVTGAAGGGVLGSRVLYVR